MKVYSDERQKLETKAADLIEHIFNGINKETITFAIPGGRSVAGIFKNLLKKKINWQKIHIFMTDERLVPLDHPDSNFHQANITFLSELTTRGKISADNIHPFPQSLDINDSLRNYNKKLSELEGKFDLVLLSAGEDGHIASLFPDHPSINNNDENYIFVSNSPKPPADRISISRNLMLRSDAAILLFLGEGKREAFKCFISKTVSSESCPCKYLENLKKLYVISDLQAEIKGKQ